MFFRKIDNWMHKQYTSLLKEDVEDSIFTQFLYRMLVWAGVGGIGLLVLDYVLLSHGQGQSIGVFGDFFGGVLSPILTFLTFIILIVTIVMQKQELRSSKIVNRKTSVETTFFNLIDLHHKIVEDLKVDINELKNIRGKLSTLKQIWEAKRRKSVFEGRIVFDAILEFIEDEADSPQEATEVYLMIQNECNHILGHYFRNLYQALKIIDKNASVLGDPRSYSSILRAQLSAKELALLFLNCLDGVCDRGQFKNLLIEYQMLEHLPVEKFDTGYLLGGSNFPITTEKMISQYKYKTELGLDLTKYYGGAFGKNPGIPYNLRAESQVDPNHDA